MIFKDLLFVKDAGVQNYQLGEEELNVRYVGESQFRMEPLFDEEQVKNPEGEERLGPI